MTTTDRYVSDETIRNLLVGEWERVKDGAWRAAQEEFWHVMSHWDRHPHRLAYAQALRDVKDPAVVRPYRVEAIAPPDYGMAFVMRYSL
jgi:hypothetical protein